MYMKYSAKKWGNNAASRLQEHRHCHGPHSCQRILAPVVCLSRSFSVGVSISNDACMHIAGCIPVVLLVDVSKAFHSLVEHACAAIWLVQALAASLFPYAKLGVAFLSRASSSSVLKLGTSSGDVSTHDSSGLWP